MKNNLLRTVALVAVLLPIGAFAAPQQTPSVPLQLFQNGAATTNGAGVQTLPPGVTPAAAQPEQDEASMSPGKKAYNGAFQHFYRDLTMLGDPGQAESFKNEWEHKFDSTGQLDNRAGVQDAVQQVVKAGQNMGCSEQFDGKCLYLRAFRAYMQYHYSQADGNPNLADPTERAAWAAQWEHRFDNTDDFKTEAGTDSAIRKMRDLLGQRFDYVFSVQHTKDERDKMKAQFAGIGIPVEMNHMGDIKLASPMELVVHEPSKTSPAYGIVHFGDVIVKIDGLPVDGMTMDEAMKKFGGKPGTHLQITVRRIDEQGHPQLIDLDMTRNYTINGLSTVAPRGDTDIGVPVEITHRDELKLGDGFELLAHEPFPGSPSVGKIKEGDLIIKADGQDLAGLTLSQAVDKIRGPAGSKVTLTVLRKDAAGNMTTIDVAVPRRAIEQHAVHYKDLGEGIGYIRLDQFESQNVPRDMSTAIAQVVLPLASSALKAAKTDPLSVAQAARFDALKRILDRGGQVDKTTLPIVLEAKQIYEDLGTAGGAVLDLRHNPGGDLQVFRSVAAMTLPAGTMMVQSQREPGTDTITIHEDILTPSFEVLADHPAGAGLDKTEATETPRVPLLLPSNMPFVVLVDEYSASASELLSGMLQANHRATIIGKSTIGKGVGQVLISLPYGRSLHVTDFEFFPGGMKSDWIGVIVDQDVDARSTDDEDKKDAQREAAVVEIKAQVKRMADRAAAAAAALKRHHDYFNGEMKDRADEDNRPLNKQDPSRHN